MSCWNFLQIGVEIMINHFREKVEKALGTEISSTELASAIAATKDDAFCNNILYDKDVSVDYFITKVCEYICCIRRSS